MGRRDIVEIHVVEDEPDCCLCFPIECGVRTLFFLLFLNILSSIYNITQSIADQQYYNLIMIFILFPSLYTGFYVVRWMIRDEFVYRNNIS